MHQNFNSFCPKYPPRRHQDPPRLQRKAASGLPRGRQPGEAAPDEAWSCGPITAGRGVPARGFPHSRTRCGRDSRRAGAGRPEPAGDPAATPQAGSEGGVRQGRAGTTAGGVVEPLAARPRGAGGARAGRCGWRAAARGRGARRSAGAADRAPARRR